jgi:hypothetical protein
VMVAVCAIAELPNDSKIAAVPASKVFFMFAS